LLDDVLEIWHLALNPNVDVIVSKQWFWRLPPGVSFDFFWHRTSNWLTTGNLD
jgi:hypothetical protein